MLKEALSYESLKKLPTDAYAARIQSLFKAYGSSFDFANFWVQGENTAVCDIDGNVTICCNAGSDFEELKCFIDFRGFRSVSVDGRYSGMLGFDNAESSYIVEYKNDSVAGIPENSCDYKSAYGILTECGFQMGSYSSFLEDFAVRVNKNTAKLTLAFSDGRPSATASALFIGENSVLLGAVGTLPEFRGNGLASLLVSALASEYFNMNKRVFLFCRNDSLLEFYKKIGFCEYGRWAQIFQR